MSLLDALMAKKGQLRPTDTTVRHVDGTQLVERASGEVQHLTRSSYGFVVDTKPDQIPAEILKKELFLGSQDAVDLEVLTRYNIRAVLSLGIECPIELPKEILRKFIFCLDLPATDFSPILEESIGFIRTCLATNCPVLVHCNAGVSRSSSVVIGYLIRECFMSFEEALRAVKYKRPAVQPNAGFLRFLKTL